MKTIDYYKRAIRAAKDTRECIQKADAEYRHQCGLVQNAYESGIIGKTGYQDELRRLETERDGKTEAAQENVLAVAKEFEAEMKEAARLDGNKVDDNALRILDSGLSLTLEDWKQLGEQYKDNWIMSRLLQQRYDTAPCYKDKGIGLMGDEGKEKVVLRFGTDPMKRAEIFSHFANLIAHTAKSGTVLEGYKDQDSYWNSLAKNSLNDIKPSGDDNFSTVDADFPVEHAKPSMIGKVW